MNNLTGRSRHSPRHCPVSADAIVSQLVRNGKCEAVDRKSSRLVSQEVSDLWRATTPDAVNISDTFSQREFTVALQHLKPGKAPGSDSICPELILHAGAPLKSWLRDFLFFCLRRLKIPKIWRRALVVAIPKPGKPVGDPKSYRPISLLCVPYKILKRLIYAPVEPLVDPLLPKEQAGFRRGKPRYCCPVEVFICFFSFIEICLKFKTTCQDHQAGESTVKCLSQKHNRVARVGF